MEEGAEQKKEEAAEIKSVTVKENPTNNNNDDVQKYSTIQLEEAKLNQLHKI